jgi:hyaluronate lyase
MAYALVPHATETALTSYARGPVTVLANTPRIQAVQHAGLRMVAVNVFAPGTHHAGRLSADGPASVILQEAPDGTIRVAVSDPTMERDAVSVTVRGRRMKAVSVDDGVRVGRVRGGTRLDITTRHAHGRSFTATLL